MHHNITLVQASPPGINALLEIARQRVREQCRFGTEPFVWPKCQPGGLYPPSSNMVCNEVILGTCSHFLFYQSLYSPCIFVADGFGIMSTGAPAAVFTGAPSCRVHYHAMAQGCVLCRWGTCGSLQVCYGLRIWKDANLYFSLAKHLVIEQCM